MRALVRDIASGSAKEGASSITQQLARNSLPLGGRTLSRKLLEAMVALRIERQFTKQQILELYVNRIYFGNGCYGVETASQAYFGRSASKLNLPEAALLAGLIRSPKSAVAAEESRRCEDPTQRCSGSNGSVKKTFACGCGSRQTGKSSSAPQAYAFCSGELRDGCSAARFESFADTRPDR